MQDCCRHLPICVPGCAHLTSLPAYHTTPAAYLLRPSSHHAIPLAAFRPAPQGPGVQAGVIDSSLVDITDVTPTVADLAGVPAGAGGHMPFSGSSFKNLLLSNASAAANATAAGALVTALSAPAPAADEGPGAGQPAAAGQGAGAGWARLVPGLGPMRMRGKACAWGYARGCRVQ